MPISENGPKRMALALLLLSLAGPLAAEAFKLELKSGDEDRVHFLASDEEPDPQGWAQANFDDSDWAPPQAFASGWLGGTLGQTWWSYNSGGRSQGHDRLLVRRRFDLPPGMSQARASLQLVVDDNVQLYLNGRRLHADASKAFVGVQPRSFSLEGDLRPCGNLLALRVYSMNPTGIGYKFQLEIEGQAGPAARCGSTPTFSATATPLPSATPTLRPTPLPTAKPTLRPTPKPLLLPTARVFAVPTLRPTPKATLRPTLRPTFLATLRPTLRPTQAAKPAPLAAGPHALATPRPWPCPPGAALAAPADANSRASLPKERVLARREPLWMGDEGQDKLSAAQRLSATAVGRELRLPFQLEKPARVWVEAQRLEGLRLGQVNAAPEVFVDEAYLGPLLAEHGGHWRSPRAVMLAAGGHSLLLRNAAVADAADLRIEGLRVLSDGQPEAPAPAPLLPPQPCACGASPAGRAWPQRLAGKALLLSVLSGRTAYTGVLSHLRQGQAWECRLRLPSRKGKPLPLAVSVERGPGALCRLIIAPDPQVQAPVNALGYSPDTWEPARLELCGGQLSLRFAQAPEIRLPWPLDELDLELGAQDLELGLMPAN